MSLVFGGRPGSIRPARRKLPNSGLFDTLCVFPYNFVPNTPRQHTYDEFQSFGDAIVKLLRKALVEGSFLLDLDERDMPSIFRQVVTYLVARGIVAAPHRDELESGLLAREEQVSTAIGNALAVPHVYLDAVREPVIVFVRLSHAVNLGAPDGIPTRFVFVLLGSTLR